LFPFGKIEHLVDRLRQIETHAALRGIAAILVVGYHLQFLHRGAEGLSILAPMFARSYLLVDLFFILSGFILSYVNRADSPAAIGALSYRGFIARRLIRLYPLLLFSIICLIILRIAATMAASMIDRPAFYTWDTESVSILASQLAMVNAWTLLPTGWNTPTWSISAELFAYLLFPGLALLLARRPRVTLVVLTIAAALFYSVVGSTGGSLDIVSFPAPFRCLAGFCLGMAIYALRDTIARLPVVLLSALQIIALIASVTILFLPVNDVLIIPAFVVLVATTWTDRGVLARVLRVRPLLYLGDISYSVYLMHIPVLDTLGLVWWQTVGKIGLTGFAGGLVWVATSYAATILVSHLTFTLLEVPARRRLTRRFLGQRAGPIALSPSAP